MIVQEIPAAEHQVLEEPAARPLRQVVGDRAVGDVVRRLGPRVLGEQRRRAVRTSTRLPIIRPWHVQYSLVDQQRTFRVYMNCAAKAAI